jgi:hypothetical protein
LAEEKWRKMNVIEHYQQSKAFRHSQKQGSENGESDQKWEDNRGRNQVRIPLEKNYSITNKTVDREELILFP